MVTANDIKAWIEQNLPNSSVISEGDGRHFSAIVICDAFESKSSMQRHRMIYQALGDHMKDAIHALSLKTYTTTEYKGL